MRLAFITATPLSINKGSGTFVGLRNLQSALKKDGHVVEVFSPTRHYKSFILETISRIIWNSCLSSKEFDNYDLIVGFDMDGYSLAGKTRTPFVAYVHGIIAEEAEHENGLTRTLLRWQSAFEKKSTQHADLVVATTHYSQKRLAEIYKLPAEKIRTLPPSIDLGQFRKDLTSVVPLRHTKQTILCVGVFYPRKNIATLIKAAALLHAANREFCVRIVGQGPQTKYLKKLITSLEAHTYITLMGPVSYGDLLREYKSCDVFCLPSLQEGFGLVFAEAMAAGKPIVALKSSSTPEVVQDGQTGLLAKAHDINDLADKLGLLLEQPAERRRLGSAGQKRVVQFDNKKSASDFIKITARLKLEKKESQPASSNLRGCENA